VATRRRRHVQQQALLLGLPVAKRRLEVVEGARAHSGTFRLSASRWDKKGGASSLFLCDEGGKASSRLAIARLKTSSGQLTRVRRVRASGSKTKKKIINQ
jgi:hypothetical protein